MAIKVLTFKVARFESFAITSAAALSGAALAGGVISLVYATLGAFVVGFLVYLTVKLSRNGDTAGYGRAYGSAFIALLASAVVTALGLFWFRDGDILWAWSAELAATAPASLPPLDFPELWRAMSQSWLVIVPGIILAGAIICARHPAPFSGMLGYCGAIVVSAVTAVPLLIPSLVAGIELSRRGLLN